MRRIGIDVGGTNTDAVLLEGTTVVRSVKRPTTADVTTGVRDALAGILADDAGGRIDAVMIGTTHFTNAVVQRVGLERAAAVRICLPAAASLEPFIDWPADLRDVVKGPVFLIGGGHEYDGRPIVPFDRAAMRRVAEEIAASGVRSVAVTSVFSPLTSESEDEAAAILAEICPDVAVTLSSSLGRIGLLERENAALLNACLRPLATKTVKAFEQALADSGLDAPLFLTQNDGTVMRAAFAERFPVFSFASGPTNSMRGAAFLSRMTDALVCDVGGTTTDIGLLRNGFPREANSTVEVGGVRTMFRMPDLVSLALGGGTRVEGDPPVIGPKSVGYEVTRLAKVFGGDVLTLTDVGVARGLAEIGDPAKVADLPPALLDEVAAWIRERIEATVDRMKTDARDVPLIVVGGGAFLVPETLAGVSEVMRVPHHTVANAVGAAIAQVSGEIDRIYRDLSRDEAIATARRAAEDNAVAAGAARDTLDLVEVEDLPLAYMPGNSLRVRIRVVGDVAGV
jgi:N-methylhydantoinase A/oxoprolinase/acetone carboxylase beta subunit